MSSFSIPWKCLDLDYEPKDTNIDQPQTTKTPKTFAQALSNLCDIPLSQFPQPVVKGDRLAIEIPEIAYQAGLDACKHNLHGRILWPKGSTPLSVVALKSKLSIIWKDLSKWGIISLGKGLFEFTFSALEDVRRVRSIPSWNLNPGMLKLFAWSKDFNPKMQHNTSAQVWVNFFGLSQEYWHKNILFAIASSLGTPICTDSVTARPMHERTFGQFARVLVDMDLSQPLRYKVIGHHVENCKRWNKEEVLKEDKDNITKKKPILESKKVYVPTIDGRAQQSKLKEVINVEKEIINVEEAGENSPQHSPKDKEPSQNVLIYSEPVLTPVNQVDHRQIDESVLSPRTSFRAQDKQLEDELNANLGSDNDTDQALIVTTPNSKDSFVNATQVFSTTASASSATAVLRQTPERVLKDMEGLANSPTRLALKKIISHHKPDFVLLAEPWMSADNLPRQWLVNFNLKRFAVNTRPNLLPNLWCLCKTNLHPTILALDDQHVTFIVIDNDKTLAISAIYASTNYLTRRKLWENLNILQSQHVLPWCFIGDFNVILGAHEHRGRFPPARLPMDDFQSWTDAFQLFHLPTRGAVFTWNNGRGGSRHTEKRLDRAVCNQLWLDTCCVSSVSTLTNHKSDHFPLFLDFQLSNTTFASHFKFMRMWSLHPDCRNIILACWNNVIVGCPMYILSQKLKTLKEKLNAWNKENFGNVHDYVFNAKQNLHQIQDKIQLHGHTDDLLSEEKIASLIYEEALNREEVFWQEKAKLNWHLEGDRNTKFFHRLAKIKTSTKVITSLQHGDQDSLLAEEVVPNLVTNDVNAVLTMLPSHDEIKAAVFALNKDSAPGPDGLATIMPSIISEEQKGFIHERNIKDCLCIASEAANLLHNKFYGGVRQGDPLSPLLFCLAEDVLSRSITKLVAQGNIHLIKGTRNLKIPSHSFYADDLLVFCKGNLSGLRAIKELFDKYALESGQMINNSKSTIFSGSITPGRLNLIRQLLNFNLGSLPFSYLGVPIFRGKPKTCHLQPVADKVKLKLSAWKASLLSIAGRVQLVRAVIQSMLIYNISLYSWSVALLKDIEKCIRNFIWSGDIDNRKLVTTSWKKNCRPYSQVSDFIVNGSWSIPSQLKAAYQFKMQQFHDLNWAKQIWSIDIPPSKSMFVWRLMNEKVPADENLMMRGCSIPSMCNLCNNHVETSFHIFFECAYAVRLWSWLAGCLDLVLQFTSMEDMWKLCDLNWSPQSNITITAAIINLLNTIWLVRNEARFNNKLIPWMSAISLIITNTALTGNNTCKSSSNSLRDFTFLKRFRIAIHNPKTPILKEIIWHPPPLNWTKCNIDGASCGNPGIASCGGIFRDHNVDFVLAFAKPLGIASSYFAELCGAMNAIEIAYSKNWFNLWLETDSSLVVAAFKNTSKPVAWPLRNRWNNVVFLLKHMNCMVTHIYREGNKVADLIANHRLNLPSFLTWNTSPLFINDCLLSNKRGMPNFRLVPT
ncbi:hypothetical protein TSUD_177560 [Trifolium subterraneum]|uniref:Uncharacterized protein n=1 Tax=Trifolium subterraneum TaxID=3900 RepID=A0A2Z6P0P2_TRISU|nr:hypothetical protein TSUD_177560 [Trifolium subterraneum]